ncbi:MAG: hypothetical protein PUE12_18130 [Oscillospiraceae bacterium]|nr:hypothetical protein [Oscillospiraceae bacterium]
MHTIFLVVGRSGSGKDSLVSKLCEECGYKQLKSYATRPRREGEGDTHTFISPDEVKQYQDQMVAYTRISDYEYFATKQQLLDSDFYVIDYRGIEYMHNLSLDISDIRFVTIYIHVPDEIREHRAINGRKDNSLTFYKRCFNENEQFTEMILRNDFDYAVSNINFDKAYRIFKTIIEEELKND